MIIVGLLVKLRLFTFFSFFLNHPIKLIAHKLVRLILFRSLPLQVSNVLVRSWKLLGGTTYALDWIRIGVSLRIRLKNELI